MSPLLDAVNKKAMLLHLAHSTRKQYVYWAEKYIRFHRGDQWKHPVEMGKPEVEAFLTYLAIGGASASTQNQALAALQFLYNRVLSQPLGNVRDLRARRNRRQPEALTVAEVKAVLGQLSGDGLSVCQLLYGSGLRLMEALRLRVKDLNLDTYTLTTHNTKSRRDRVVPIASSTVESLRVHLEQVREMWQADCVVGYAGASFPLALERKYSAAPREWLWQFVFPATKLTRWEDGTLRRHHLHSSAIQKAVRRAAKAAGLIRRCTPHIFRHSYATHQLQGGVDIRTVQQMMGHKDIRTTMGYLRAKDATEVPSPLDGMAF